MSIHHETGIFFCPAPKGNGQPHPSKGHIRNPREPNTAAIRKNKFFTPRSKAFFLLATDRRPFLYPPNANKKRKKNENNPHHHATQQQPHEPTRMLRKNLPSTPTMAPTTPTTPKKTRHEIKKITKKFASTKKTPHICKHLPPPRESSTNTYPAKSEIYKNKIVPTPKSSKRHKKSRVLPLVPAERPTTISLGDR